jgi:hypothetical protein
MLHKSKKVWFRIKPPPPGAKIKPEFLYGNQQILHKHDIKSWPERQQSQAKSETILWGQQLSHGWGRGPDDTTYYLDIWTRWSWLHPAQCHPERFSIRYEYLTGSLDHDS